MPIALNSLATDEAQASDEGEIGASSFENGERNINGYQSNDKDFRVVWIYNNNFEVADGGTTPESEPEPQTCEECFEEKLSSLSLENLLGYLSGVGWGLPEFCNALANQKEKVP